MALSRTDFGPYGATPTQGTGPFTTSSFTPSAGSFLVVGVLFGTDSPASADSYVISDSGGLTWTKHDQTAVTFSGDGAFVQVWSAPGASGSAMTVTLTHTGINSYAGYIFPHAFTGHNASSPVGTFETGTQNNSAVGLTLPASPATTSDVVGWCAAITSNADGSGSSITPGTGITEIAESYVNNSFMRTQSQRRTSSTSTTFDWSVTANTTAPFNQRLMGAIEIKEAAAGTAVPVFAHHYRTMKAA